MTGTKSGETRTLTASEFGSLVAMFRKAFDWKQITLAHAAGVDERTVQRIEAGQPVSNETRRQIAKAFKLPEDYFVRITYVPSDEEVHVASEKLKKEFAVVDARPLQTARDFEEIFGQGHAFFIDGTALPEEMQGQVAAFKDSFHDWTWIYSDVTHVDRLEAHRSLLEEVKKISGDEYRAFFAIYRAEKPSTFNVVAITFVSNKRELTQLVLPRTIEQFDF